MRWAILVILATGASLQAAPAGWKVEQEVEVSTPGLHRLELSPEILGAARTDLQDLRLWDGEGKEVPFRVLRPAAEQPRELQLAGFSCRMQSRRTEAWADLPPGESVDAVRVGVAANSFLKAAQVDVSEDGTSWRVVARGQPLFRQPGQPENLRVEFPRARARRVRVTLDDALSPAVPVQNMTVRTSPESPVPDRTMNLPVVARAEEGGRTRLDVLLPARFLRVQEIRLRMGDAFYSRRVSAETFGGMGDEDVLPLTSDTLFRRRGSSGGKEERSSLSVRMVVPDRRVRLLIENQDAPPLDLREVQVVYQLPVILFQVDRPGRWVLGVGHSSVFAPQYEAAGLPAAESLPSAREARPGLVRPNPAYDVQASFAFWPDAAGALDAHDWRFRAPVKVKEAGFQVLSVPIGVWAEGGAFMLGKGNVQVPFEEEPDGEDGIGVEARLLPGGRGGVSRWELRTPFPRLAARRLEVRVKEGIFQRRVWVEEDEDVRDAWGSRKGDATWTVTPGSPVDRLVVQLRTPFTSDRFRLCIQDGNNAALTLSEFRLVVDKAVLVFKAAPADDLWLYYGHDKMMNVPTYDLSLAREELRKMDKKEASLGPPERAGGWGGPAALAAPAQRVVFGIVLLLVAGVILLLIVKLFPKIPEK